MSPRLRGFFGTLRGVFSNFSKDGGMHLAAAVSFYAMLSIFPLLFLLLHYFANLLARSKDLQSLVFGYVKTLYPMAGDMLRGLISGIAEYKGAGWISLILFLWVGSFVFESLDFSLNIIFKTKKKRRFLFSKLISMGLVIISGLLFVLSFWVAYIPNLLHKFPKEIYRSKAVIFITKSLLLQVTPFILTLAAFTLVYKILPKVKVPWRLAATGGLIAAVLWEAAKYAFAWYIGSVANLNVYGSISAMIIFMLWVYYSSAIVLLVAEWVHIAMQGKTS